MRLLRVTFDDCRLPHWLCMVVHRKHRAIERLMQALVDFDTSHNWRRIAEIMNNGGRG